MGTHSRSGAGRPVGSKSGCTLKMITDSCKTLSAEQRRKVMEYAERVSSGSSDSEEEVEFEVADPEEQQRAKAEDDYEKFKALVRDTITAEDLEELRSMHTHIVNMGERVKHLTEQVEHLRNHALGVETLVDASTNT